MFTTTMWFDKESCQEIARDIWRSPAPDAELLERLRVQYQVPADAIVWQSQDRQAVAEGDMLLVDGVPQPDPAWQPPAPRLDSIQELTEMVRRNIAASPHDKRFLTQKAIGKQAITWIKEHPACTPQEAEDYVMDLVQTELPGEPMVPKLYWEHQGEPQGLAMSYLHEAIRRGYLPEGTPMTWAILVGLIVATPATQISAWLRSL